MTAVYQLFDPVCAMSIRDIKCIIDTMNVVKFNIYSYKNHNELIGISL